MGLTGFNRRRRAVVAAGAHEASAAAAPADAEITELDVPPREGRGSGKQAWVDFAATVPGLVIDENDTRDEIAAKFDALVAENDAKLAAAQADAEAEAAALALAESADTQNDGDDAQTAEAGAGDGSEHNGDDSSDE